jgi:hypothetical protein
MPSQNINHGGANGDHYNHRTRESTHNDGRSAALDAYLEKEWAAALLRDRVKKAEEAERRNKERFRNFMAKEVMFCPRNMFED